MILELFWQKQCVRYYDQNLRTEFLRQKTQQNTVPPLLPFAAQPLARKASGSKNGSKIPSGGFSSSLFKRLLKFVGGLLAVSGLAVAGAPYLISFGHDGFVYLINQSIPGNGRTVLTFHTKNGNNSAWHYLMNWDFLTRTRLCTFPIFQYC